MVRVVKIVLSLKSIPSLSNFNRSWFNGQHRAALDRTSFNGQHQAGHWESKSEVLRLNSKADYSSGGRLSSLYRQNRAGQESGPGIYKRMHTP